MEENILDRAIELLQIHSDIMKNNEPISRQKGDVLQADLQLRNSISYDRALQILCILRDLQK